MIFNLKCISNRTREPNTSRMCEIQYIYNALCVWVRAWFTIWSLSQLCHIQQFGGRKRTVWRLEEKWESTVEHGVQTAWFSGPCLPVFHLHLCLIQLLNSNRCHHYETSSSRKTYSFYISQSRRDVINNSCRSGDCCFHLIKRILVHWRLPKNE